MTKAVTCYARRLSETVPDVYLPDGERVVLGRGPLTRIRDRSVSREQVALVANYEDFSVRLEVIGGNPSGLRGTPLQHGRVSRLHHKEELQLLVNAHAFVIIFDPPPPNEDEVGEKRRLQDTDSSVSSPPSKKQRMSTSSLYKAPTFKALQSDDRRSWIEVNLNEAHIMITKEGSDPNPKLAVFDMDGTLITTKSGNVFPKNMDDWQILYPTVPGKLKSLLQEGFRLVVYTNQGGVAKGKTPLRDVVTKIENIFLWRLQVPVTVLACTASGGFFRKPRTALWEHFIQEYNEGLIDKGVSFYVGDAAGRDKGWKTGKKKDFSVSDRLFALNAGLRFYTPEEHFLSESPTSFYSMPKFDPYNTKVPSSLLEPSDSELESKEQEVVMLVGMQGSGKSFFARTYFPNYVLASNDVSGGREKTLRVLENALSSGKSVVIDNTHPEASTRAKYIQRVSRGGTRIRCFLMSTEASQARHNNLFRELTGEEHVKINEILFNQYANKFEMPSLKEGFHSIVKVHFIPQFKSEDHKKLYHSYLLEK